MTKITSAACVASGKELLAYAAGHTVPYVAGGMTLEGMDCQGLAEYLLIRCGVPRAECDLKGSNAHWRSCVWRGTPEECAKAFGAVPPGAWVFIVNVNDDGAPEKYRGDGLGDAGHMGVYLGGESAVHASASRGCVAESRFAGRTIPNGGWNAVGLPSWVDYGGDINAALAELDDGGEAEGALAGKDAPESEDAREGASGGVDDTLAGKDAPDTGGGASGGGESGARSGAVEGLSAGTPVQSAAIYATVASPDGNPVKLRKSASRKESVYWLVNPGARARVEKVKGDWSLVTAVCSDGHQRRAYMMSAFLRG